MDYYKITINITPFEEWLRDVLTAQLGEIGFESFLETETGIEAFIPVANFSDAEMEYVLNAFQDDFTFSINKEIIKSQNWNEVWEKNYFKPLVVNNKCVIRAPFHTEYPKAKYEIIIEPNMAFGTGNHETTTLMIETILENEMENKNILDMGCGSGILGILASMKGAKKVTAIDIDEWSYKGANENAALNKIENMVVVFSGAGAAAIACAKIFLDMGLKPQNLILTDSKGVIYKGRTDGMNKYKEQFAIETSKRTLADAMKDADAFVGCSAKGVLTKEMVATMAKNPIIFALSNPVPEIFPKKIKKVTQNYILATGRSDFPNQINNLIVFPGILRGLLDSGRKMNLALEFKIAKSITSLIKKPRPNYIIPSPFDKRLVKTIVNCLK